MTSKMDYADLSGNNALDISHSDVFDEPPYMVPLRSNRAETRTRQFPHIVFRQVLPVVFLLGSQLAHADGARVVEIEAGSYYFKPDVIRVKAGEPVTLNVRNVATLLPHNLVIEAPQAGVEVRIETRAGQTAGATFTPTLPGTYEIYCGKAPPFFKSHKARGMHGKLIVE